MTEPGNENMTHQPAKGFKETATDNLATLKRIRLQTWFLGIIAFGVILFLLVQARFILISLVIAIILFSLTSDAIHSIAKVRIGGLRIPTTLASIAALAILTAGLVMLTLLVLSQANTVVHTVVQYTDPAQRVVAKLFSWMGANVEASMLQTLEEIQFGDYLRTAAGQASDLVQATILIILFVGFLFAERIWFSTKLTSLFGDEHRAARAELIIGSIMHRVNRYLLVKTLISAVTGLLTYLVVQAFGLELAVAIGLLTFVLNYIPNVGSIAATVIAAMMGYVQTGDQVLGLGLLAVLTVLQFAIGQVIDPLLLGRALRLSSFGIIMSLAFWAALWGIPGMFLAVPIMVGLLIICSQLPDLRMFAILLSRDGLPETTIKLDDERGI